MKEDYERRLAEQYVAEVDPSIYESYSGLYTSIGIGGMSVTVMRNNDKLYMELEGQQPIELFPQGETYFIHPFFDNVLHANFIIDETEHVTQLIIRTYGMEFLLQVASSTGCYEETTSEMSQQFVLDQNCPNPFNPVTAIGFTLPADRRVSLDIFNIAGQKVETLVDGVMTSGRHSVVWDASGYSGGIYFGAVTDGKCTQSMKMMLLK